MKQDITIYLQIDPKIANERINSRNEIKTRFEQEDEDFWYRVIDGFESIFATRKNVITVDATATPEEILDQVINNSLFLNLMESYAAQQ